MIPPEFFGFTPDLVAGVDLDVYMARVLERYFEVMLRVAQKDPNSLLINYQADGMTMMQELIQFLKLTPNEADYAAMKLRCSYHGKYPEQQFSPERAEQAVPDYLQSALDLYQQLEKKREQSLLRQLRND